MTIDEREPVEDTNDGHDPTAADYIRDAKDQLTFAANALHTDSDAGAVLANNRVRDAIATCNDALEFLGEGDEEGDA